MKLLRWLCKKAYWEGHGDGASQGYHYGFQDGQIDRANREYVCRYVEEQCKAQIVEILMSKGME